MAQTLVSVVQNDGIMTATWTTLDSNDEGPAAKIGAYADKTVSVSGTFGAAGSVTMQGSNDNVNWHTLNDFLGVAVTFTAAGLMLIAQNPVYMRPKVTAGDGTTALKVVIAARR